MDDMELKPPYNWEMDYNGHCISGETNEDGEDEEICACFDVVEDFGEDAEELERCDIDPFTAIYCDTVKEAMELIDKVVAGEITSYGELF